MKRGEIQVRHEEEIIYSGGGEALAQLPREAVGAPSLEELKARLDGALGSLSCWVADLPMAVAWIEMVFKVQSNPNHSVTPQSKQPQYELFTPISTKRFFSRFEPGLPLRSIQL